MSKKLHERLNREAEQLKKFYSSSEGLQNLIEFYIRAETQLLVEPAGIYNPQENTFTFFPIPKQNKRWNDAILTGRKEDIATLIAKIKEDLNKPEDHKRKKLIHDNLVFHCQGKNSIQHAHYCLTEYLRFFYNRPDAADGIEVHIHPHIKTRLSDETGKEISFEPGEGYSRADKDCSKNKTLGLIEYAHNIIEDKTLFISFTIHHRAAQEELAVATPRIIAPLYGTPASGIYSLSRKKYPTTEALTMLIQSAHIRPLMIYDEDNTPEHQETYEHLKRQAEELHKKTWDT